MTAQRIHDDLKAARRHLTLVEGTGSKYAQKKARQRVAALEAELAELELEAAEARLWSSPDAEAKRQAAEAKAAELAAEAAGFFSPADVRALARGQAEAARWRGAVAEQAEVVLVMEQRYDGTEPAAHALVEAIRDLRIVEQLALTAEGSALADSDGTTGGFLG